MTEASRRVRRGALIKMIISIDAATARLSIQSILTIAIGGKGTSRCRRRREGIHSATCGHWGTAIQCGSRQCLRRWLYVDHQTRQGGMWCKLCGHTPSCCQLGGLGTWTAALLLFSAQQGTVQIVCSSVVYTPHQSTDCALLRGLCWTGCSGCCCYCCLFLWVILCCCCCLCCWLPL